MLFYLRYLLRSIHLHLRNSSKASSHFGRLRVNFVIHPTQDNRYLSSNCYMAHVCNTRNEIINIIPKVTMYYLSCATFLICLYSVFLVLKYNVQSDGEVHRTKFSSGLLLEPFVGMAVSIVPVHLHPNRHTIPLRGLAPSLNV